MELSGNKLLFSLAIAIATAALPAGAAAESIAPPENSAVAQYTELLPTAGGQTDAHGQKHRNASPGKVLGARNVERLARHGPDGRATAELAAETAPSPAPAPAPGGGGGGGGGSAATIGAGRPGGASPANRGDTAHSRGGAAFDVSKAKGSSGLGTVLSGALGSPSGGIGLLLPFLLVAAVVVALTFAIRQSTAS